MMKLSTLPTILPIFITSAFTGSALAGTTAREAIRVLEKEEGTQVTSKVVKFTGRFGQDQPGEWEILAHRGDHHAMFIVDEKSIQSVSRLRSRLNRPINLTSLKIDSDQVFRIADKSAKKADVGFDSLNYELNQRRDKDAAVWVVRLNDSAGLTVGELHVAADDGSLLRSNWDRQFLNRPARRAPSTGGTRGIIADRRSGSVQTETTGEAVRNTIRSVFGRGSAEVSDQPQRRSPSTTKTRPR